MVGFIIHSGLELRKSWSKLDNRLVIKFEKRLVQNQGYSGQNHKIDVLENFK